MATTIGAAPAIGRSSATGVSAACDAAMRGSVIGTSKRTCVSAIEFETVLSSATRVAVTTGIASTVGFASTIGFAIRGSTICTSALCLPSTGAATAGDSVVVASIADDSIADDKAASPRLMSDGRS